jgi:2-dehydro-3-deoxy-D-arabinonate dehydratase
MSGSPVRLVQVIDEHAQKRVGVLQDGEVGDLTKVDPVLASSTASLLRAPRDGSFIDLVRNLASAIVAPSWRFDEVNRPPGPHPYLICPVDAPEIWCAGVTYKQSREARVLESKWDRDVYARVYDAPRPELFLKTSHMLRTSGPNDAIGIRSDSNWTVPEPELAVVLGQAGEIVGFTIGNDVSARDIEAENPLYVPQAKTFRGCCSLGPALLLVNEPTQLEDWTIRLEITEDNRSLFSGEVPISSLKRSLSELVDCLCFNNDILPGTVLMTGTGIVPDATHLRKGQVVHISIDAIGSLVNPVVDASERVSTGYSFDSKETA